MIKAVAATEHDQAVTDVMAKEPALLDPATRARPDAVIGLLHARFREFGASGRIWEREGIAAALAADPGGPVDVEDMRGERLGTDVILLTYRARRPDRTLYQSQSHNEIAEAVLRPLDQPARRQPVTPMVKAGTGAGA